MTKTFEQYKVTVEFAEGVDMRKAEDTLRGYLGLTNGEIKRASLTGIKVESWDAKEAVLIWTILHEDPEYRIENTMFYATGEEENGYYRHEYIGEVEVDTETLEICE